LFSSFVVTQLCVVDSNEDKRKQSRFLCLFVCLFVSVSVCVCDNNTVSVCVCLLYILVVVHRSKREPRDLVCVVSCGLSLVSVCVL